MHTGMRLVQVLVQPGPVALQHLVHIQGGQRLQLHVVGVSQQPVVARHLQLLFPVALHIAQQPPKEAPLHAAGPAHAQKLRLAHPRHVLGTMGAMIQPVTGLAENWEATASMFIHRATRGLCASMAGAQWLLAQQLSPSTPSIKALG